MKTFQKLTLALVEGWQEFQVPGYRQTRTVNVDGAGNLCVWVGMDTEQPAITTAFQFTKPGEPAIEEEGVNFINSVIVIGPEEYYVWERRIEWPVAELGLPEP